jgi:hypothetical protein
MTAHYRSGRKSSPKTPTPSPVNSEEGVGFTRRGRGAYIVPRTFWERPQFFNRSLAQRASIRARKARKCGISDLSKAEDTHFARRVVHRAASTAHTYGGVTAPRRATAQQEGCRVDLRTHARRFARAQLRVLPGTCNTGTRSRMLHVRPSAKDGLSRIR